MKTYRIGLLIMVGLLSISSFSFGQNGNTASADTGNKLEQLSGAGGNTNTDTKCDIKGATKNSLGLCQCPENTKRIDNECKSCDDEGVCCGVELNTNVPFIGKCIEQNTKSSGTGTSDPNETKVTQDQAFPVLMGGLTKILVTVIILMGFIGILAGGVMITSSGGETSRASEGKKLIGKVVIALAILGASGVILRLVNPTFFG